MQTLLEKTNHWESYQHIGEKNRRPYYKLFYLLVILVNISVGKSLPTELAFVGLVFAVGHFVGTHLVEPLEGLITNLTIIGPFLCGK